MERLTIKVASAYRLPSRPIPTTTTTTTTTKTTTSTTTNRAAAAAAAAAAPPPLSTPDQPTTTPTSTTTPSSTPISLETINNELLKLNGGAEVTPATFGHFENVHISPGTVLDHLHCTNEKFTKNFLTSEEELFTPEEEEELDNSEEGQKIFLQRLQGVYEDASKLLTS